MDEEQLKIQGQEKEKRLKEIIEKELKTKFICHIAYVIGEGENVKHYACIGPSNINLDKDDFNMVKTMLHLLKGTTNRTVDTNLGLVLAQKQEDKSKQQQYG